MSYSLSQIDDGCGFIRSIGPEDPDDLVPVGTYGKGEPQEDGRLLGRQIVGSDGLSPVRGVLGDHSAADAGRGHHRDAQLGEGLSYLLADSARAGAGDHQAVRSFGEPRRERRIAVTPIR